jgi:hypothetical protein
MVTPRKFGVHGVAYYLDGTPLTLYLRAHPNDVVICEQQQDLNLLLPLRATPKHDQLEQSPKRPVHERQDHALRTTRHRR